MEKVDEAGWGPRARYQPDAGDNPSSGGGGANLARPKGREGRRPVGEDDAGAESTRRLLGTTPIHLGTVALCLESSASKWDCGGLLGQAPLQFGLNYSALWCP